MPKSKTELEQRCPSPPYTRWDQRGKPVLLCHLKRINGKSLCLSLETDDPEIAKRHMRMLVPMLLANGRLSADAGAAKVYGPKGTRRSRIEKGDTEIRRLKALSDAEYGSEALATAKSWGCPVGIIHYLAGRRPALSVGTYATRRMRARQRGEQTPIGTSWHHRRQGDKYFYSDNGVLHARIQLEGRVYQWSLDTRDVEVAAAIMAPVRLARERVRVAAVEMLGCELGAAAAAAAVREEACSRYAEAIVRAGGPKELAEFVTKGPQKEVGAQRSALSATRRRQAAEKECRQLSGQGPSMLDLVAKSVRKPAPRFMQWARGSGGELVLQCAVYLSDGSRLSSVLNTDDTELEGPQRMRLLLSHAIVEGQLPRGEKHPAWGLYGGPIPQASKRLLTSLAALPWKEYELKRTAAAQRLGYHASTIDWLTKQDKAREADPVRRARTRTLARSRARKVGKLTPISRSWQLGAVGGMLAVHSDNKHVYAQLTIAGFTMRWPLAVQNRAEGQALVKPAVDARARVREAARDWRECPVGSPEAKTALTAVLREQRRFRDALLAIGASRSKRWAEVIKALKEPPFDEATRPDLEGCTRWFVELLLKNPERPPPGRPVEILLKEADALFRVGGRGARLCYRFAQENTGNRNWSATRRPRKSES